MSIFSWLFGASKAAPPDSVLQSQFPSGHSQSRKPRAMSQDMRRELLRVALRDTLQRHGIPTAWVVAEMLTATSRNRQTGLHWRLSIRHWDPRLLTHTVALQNRLIRRVQAIDPMAESWLMGISWQVAVADESACPDMPHPGSWTAVPASERAAARAREVEVAIANMAGVPAGELRAEGDGGDRTQPMFMKTERARP